MKAVVYTRAGGPEVVAFAEVPRPVPTGDLMRVRVHATALNRGDVLQRQGEYEIPAGQSTIPGVEVAGTVDALGERVTGFRLGERVFGVVEGGGFAEYCLLDQGMANRIPEGWGFREAAAAAESGLTSNETLFTLGGLEAGQRVLIHAGASGIGTTMIQMAHHVGATVFATVGSQEKADAVRTLGVSGAIHHRRQDFVQEVLNWSDGRGIELVMDFVGGAYLSRNLEVLRPGGCLVVVGLLEGLEAPINLLRVVEKRLQLKGSSLRLRPMEEKREVNRRYQQRWLDVLGRHMLRPIIHAEYPLAEVKAAQEEMEAHRNIGKLILWVQSEGDTP